MLAAAGIDHRPRPEANGIRQREQETEPIALRAMEAAQPIDNGERVEDDEEPAGVPLIVCRRGRAGSGHEPFLHVELRMTQQR
jgi:hypothetical protein